jgi:hypothetical protein
VVRFRRSISTYAHVSIVIDPRACHTYAATRGIGVPRSTPTKSGGAEDRAVASAAS